MKYRRILLKLSGESLGIDGKLFDHQLIMDIAAQLKSIVDMEIELGVVIGAGNLWRGRQSETCNMDLNNADQMGMLSTAINCIYMRDALGQLGVKAHVQSAIDIQRFVDPFNVRKADEYMSKGQVVMFACGTGNPLFSTDSAVVLRAIELQADAIFMAKNVDGIYDKDPNKNNDAKFIKNMTYSEVRLKNLKAIDATALALCEANCFPLVHIFKLIPENIMAALRKEPIGTLLHP